jgi:glycosyltransferase involved in cell wall biosynthesis
MRCALAVAASGGSAEYAVHGETALVSEAADAATLAAHVEELLLDPQRRTELARMAVERARAFTWDRSARILERFLDDYAVDPRQYQWAPDRSPSPRVIGLE